MSKQPLAISEAKSHHIPLSEMQTMAEAFAKGGYFGVRTTEQALSLMLLCQAENLHPALAMRRYHIVDNKPSMRADAMQGEFEQTGAILWHERTEVECSATFFKDKKQVTPEAITRAKERYKLLKEGKSAAHLAEVNELTIIRTMQDAMDKKVALTWNDKAKRDDGKTGGYVLKHNWKQSPRQMLHARCLTEGVRAISPGLIAGIYTEDEISDMVVEEVTARPQNGEAEARVTAATANALELGGPGEIIDATPKPVVSPAIPDDAEITAENYGQVVCHIGKAEGQMLGKKVGEIPTAILEWLRDSYGKKWGRLGDSDPGKVDARLKQAVEFALKAKGAPESAPVAQEKPPPPTEPPTQVKRDSEAPGAPIDWRTVGVPFECKIRGKALGDCDDGFLRAIKSQLIDPFDWGTASETAKAFRIAFDAACRETGALMDVEELRAGMLERADGLVLTEPQLVGYLKKQGVLEANVESLADADEKMLRYIWKNWALLEEAIKDELQAPVKAEPDKKRGKANKKKPEQGPFA